MEISLHVSGFPSAAVLFLLFGDEFAVLALSFLGAEVPASFDFFAFFLCDLDGFALTFDSFEFAQFPCGQFSFRVKTVRVIDLAFIYSRASLVIVVP